MSLSDVDWENLSGLHDGNVMAVAILASLLVEAGLLPRERIIEVTSRLVQALPHLDPRAVVLEKFLQAVAENAALAPYPKATDRVPQIVRDGGSSGDPGHE